MTLEEIINRISYIRTRANLSARELSLRIGKNESYINRLEYRKNFEPSVTVISDIVKVCGSSMEEFFYSNIEQYKKDKHLIDIIRPMSAQKKEALLEFLKY